MATPFAPRALPRSEPGEGFSGSSDMLVSGFLRFRAAPSILGFFLICKTANLLSYNILLL
jgi:hypothetical protein